MNRGVYKIMKVITVGFSGKFYTDKEAYKIYSYTRPLL